MTDFWVFWQSKHAGGILRGTALTGQSFSPNGGFPTPFVPDLMFSGRFWPRYIACLNSQEAVVASQQPQYAVVAQQQPLCGCHTASVWLPHRGSLCGCHTASLWLPHSLSVASTQTTRCGTGGAGGAGGAWKVWRHCRPRHTQTHTQDRNPALRGEKPGRPATCLLYTSPSPRD